MLTQIERTSISHYSHRWKMLELPTLWLIEQRIGKWLSFSENQMSANLIFYSRCITAWMINKSALSNTIKDGADTQHTPETLMRSNSDANAALCFNWINWTSSARYLWSAFIHWLENLFINRKSNLVHALARILTAILYTLSVHLLS